MSTRASRSSSDDCAAASTGVTLADDAFARLVGSAGDRVLLFEVAQDFVEEEWSEPVRYRFVRTDRGLLSMEVARV
jgi:hypothetical protein